MPSVSQTIPNFLGGVSRQVDDKKRVNQLTECINGYPDPTFGLLKRPGMKYIDRLEETDGTVLDKADLEDAAWFFIDRAAAGSYVGCIKGTSIYVWRASDGAACTITMDTGTTAYLTGTGQDDYHFLSIQDTTFITNKTVTAVMQDASSYVTRSQGTLRLKSVVNGDIHKIRIKGHDGTDFGDDFFDKDVTVQSAATFDSLLTGTHVSHEILGGVKDLIEDRHTASDTDFDGAWYLNSYADSLTIRRVQSATNEVLVDEQPAADATYLQFRLRARGGVANDAIESFQDSVIDVTKLPIESYQDHTITVLNSDSEDDDYYLKFVADDGVDGEGYWQETHARDVSDGFDAATMPHRLINTGATAFTFSQSPWVDRQAGDDVTNKPPSIFSFDTDENSNWSGSTITATFFYSNRFGILSGDNVIFSTANDPYNFFARSALTQSAADPIDLSVSSIRPVKLSSVLPSAQGLLLFSQRQQFQVYTTDNSSLTPSTAYVRSLSNYEMVNDIAPVDVGTTTTFISTVPGYSKLFTMDLRGSDEPPLVLDISKTVVEWIPDTINSITASAPNSCVILVDTGSSYMYVYKYYNNGEEDVFQAWSKWQVPGTIQAASIINDALTIISQHEDEYTLGVIELDELPNGEITATTSNFEGNVALDMTTRPVKPATDVDAVVYDETNDVTKIYVPYTPISEKAATMLLTLPEADEGTVNAIDADEGYYATATERTEQGTNYRYFEVKGNFSDYDDGIVVGYPYDLDVTLPKFYYQTQNGADFTGSLVINRIELSVGRTGSIKFKVKPFGSNQFLDVQHTTIADLYKADTDSLVDEKIFTLPINQRNTNFELKITSDFPYPVSLVSLVWEGNYSPRYYQRA